MFDFIARSRTLALATFVCAAAVTAAACAHTQQVPPASADDTAPQQQGGHRYGGRHQRGDAGMMRGIQLTSDQRAQITLIRDRYRLQADSLRQASAPRDSTARAAFRSLMMQQRSDIRAVLTPDQQTTFDQNLAAMQQRMQKRRDRNGPAYDRGNDSPLPPDTSSSPPA
jgi:Spy/CpxP family protein refolding chaperone